MFASHAPTVFYGTPLRELPEFERLGVLRNRALQALIFEFIVVGVSGLLTAVRRGGIGIISLILDILVLGPNVYGFYR